MQLEQVDTEVDISLALYVCIFLFTQETCTYELDVYIHMYIYLLSQVGEPHSWALLPTRAHFFFFL
jgi:hypothetical protein